jgi:hypothetical protein
MSSWLGRLLNANRDTAATKAYQNAAMYTRRVKAAAAEANPRYRVTALEAGGAAAVDPRGRVFHFATQILPTNVKPGDVLVVSGNMMVNVKFPILTAEQVEQAHRRILDGASVWAVLRDYGFPATDEGKSAFDDQVSR